MKINVDLSEKLWQQTADRMLHHVPVKTLCSNGINFINKDDARGFLLCQLKSISNELSSITDEHLEQFTKMLLFPKLYWGKKSSTQKKNWFWMSGPSNISHNDTTHQQLWGKQCIKIISWSNMIPNNVILDQKLAEFAIQIKVPQQNWVKLSITLSRP